MDFKTFDALICVKSAVAQVEIDLIEEVERSIMLKHFHQLEKRMAGLAAALGVDNGSVASRANFYPVNSR